jgi:hypothetical protein
MGKVGSILGVLCLATFALAGSGDHVLPGVKMTVPPTIDGVVDTEKEWAGIPSGTGFVDQTNGEPGEVATTFWMAYDEKYVYFAAKMADPDPKRIKANAYQTNVSMSGDDLVVLQLDPFGSFSEWNIFQMNPRGATRTMLAGGRAAKREWAGEFVAKGRVTADGWEVEARIPWGIMRLPSPGPRTMRFDLYRHWPAKDRYLDWSSYMGSSNEEMGRWTNVVVPPIDQRRTLKLLPFGYIGALEGGAAILDGGLDMKTALADRLDFVGSIKPDFRNVENQILSLDYSHYELIADESRPFFKEGADYLDPWDEGTQFTSQRIPDFDVGAKVHGKLSDKTNVGILNVNTVGESNAFVATLFHRMDQNTSIGASATSLDGSGRRNQTGGLSASRSMGKFHAYAGAVISDDPVTGQGHFANANATYMADGLYVLGSYKEISPDFNPALGYAPEVDLKGGRVEAYYSKPLTHGQFREWSANVTGSNYQSFDNTHFSSALDVDLSGTLKNGANIILGSHSGRYAGIDEHYYTLSVQKPQYDPVRNWYFGVTWGSMAGGDYLTPSFGWACRPLQALQLGFRYQLVDHFGSSDLAILTASYDLGGDNRISSRAVKRNEHWNAYVAYSRMGNRGTEYFLIFGDPNALSFRASLIFKVTVPFEIRL